MEYTAANALPCLKKQLTYVWNVSELANKKQINHELFRHGIQATVGIAQNSKFGNFFSGKIYKGALKNFCVPGMNCYSCPGAVGACPIGSLQAVVGGKKKFSFYVLGYLALIGVLVGRFVCGWLCLFGLIQELLYKIPTPKLKIPDKIDKKLRYLKYFFLFVFVFLLTALLKAENGLVSVPYFCKYICPVGMLEGGIPLVSKNADLQSSVGGRYAWKGFLLAATVLTSIFIYRPFCKYVCPLGAFYGIFQKFCFLRLTVDKDKCIGCNACAKQCKMNVDVVHNPNSAECIRCGECTKCCPKGALSFTVLNKTKKKETNEQSIEVTDKKRYIIIMAAALIAAGLFIFKVNTSDAADIAVTETYGALNFTVQEIYGGEVNSDELFAKADVTMINVWASYCSPCAKELPELSELNKKLADKGVQIITILWDSDTDDTDEAEIALNILETSGTELMCLLHNDTLETLLSKDIIGMPTSFLVDSAGNIIAPAKTGADSVDNYEKWITEHMG